MRTKISLSALFAVAILGLTSCSNDNSTELPPVETKEAYINATSKTTWYYFSLAENKVIGTGEENTTDNATWAARKDWDVAVNRYLIRTNSGAATSASAQGGVYTFGASTTFNSVTTVPAGASFVTDKAISSEGMGGATTTTVKSEATVIVFKTNEDGSMIMPPVYLQAPVYIFRTANGKENYKIQFTQYQDENKVTGHVKFYSAKI